MTPTTLAPGPPRCPISMKSTAGFVAARSARDELDKKRADAMGMQMRGHILHYHTGRAHSVLIAREGYPA